MAILVPSVTTILVVLLVLILVGWYIHFRSYTCRHWSARRIPHLKPVFLLGNIWRGNITVNIMELLSDMHLENRKKKILGFWVFHKPHLLITDLELTKRILIKDFDHFRDRGFDLDVGTELISEQLAVMKGRKWRNLRVKLTPTFTSGKMKMMYPSMVKCGQELGVYLRAPAEGKEEVGVKDVLSRFTTDVISTCAFGLETNSLKNPNSEFWHLGQKLLRPGWRTTLINLAFFAFPKISKVFKIRIFPKDVTDFFINAIRDTIEYREKTQTTRNDFLQLLIQLMRAGKIEDVDKTPLEGLDDEEIVKKFSLMSVAAQCFTFFFAGFENSSSALTYALYELALNPDIQARLHKEIDDTLEENNGDITYDSLCGMEYLDMVVQETLRKYPPAGNLMRKCAKDYYIPELDVTIEKDTPIMFSVTGIHRDPDIYPDPDKFDPERFSAEERGKRDSCAFLAFGEGPRNCIGNRFALMQIKVGLLSVLKEYRVEVCKSTPIPIKWNPRSFTPTPIGGMSLAFTRRM